MPLHVLVEWEQRVRRPSPAARVVTLVVTLVTPV